MALVNLAMSFETGLAATLIALAPIRGQPDLVDAIEKAAIGKLGQALSQSVLGSSLQNATFWGERAPYCYTWIMHVRNKVLHRARTTVTIDTVTRNFEDPIEAGRLFEEVKDLKLIIKNRVEAILNGAL